ncbi:hemophore-related protein [Mycobacterium ulcerans]|uniref:hemophore-related protein n=1 Tax=Mycobacterium ulcerans TaxID=1809 RepID=UPI0012DBF967|nr:hemophore-related protein [Mycobacterium ulcerans]MEB3970210.1 hemophore-related protein [Mycobacterium ulcerans]MEB3978453.1 hemophore-related protein [Mycobacterium ulcerans]MEB4007733.1 hemophore-related protein [Mycobacterium ulcerans]MEB4417332.1 hemophore-related protein [Mycobacterium ulcerans]MEB4435480.1 hemophore-related protein [Mycobacterium ulcerans]
MRLSLTGLGVAAGAFALSLSVGAGVASASPLDTVINTTCNYGQVMAALNATDPGAAAQFNASPVAQGWLHSFLASPPPRRAQMATQLQAMPGASQYVGLVESVASSCNNY